MDLSNNLDSLEELLSYKFSKRELLKLSLTHRSFSQENNEIYEFLGDSIINLCASIWLMNKNKDLSLVMKLRKIWKCRIEKYLYLN